MPTVQGPGVWAENAGVGVSQWAAKTMGIGQEKSGLTTQQINIKVRERVREIAQSMSIINKQGARPERWDLQFDRCVTRTSDLTTTRPLWNRYMADTTNLDVQKLKPALTKFTVVGLRRMENRLDATLTEKRTILPVYMYLITPMLLFFFLMMRRHIR